MNNSIHKGILFIADDDTEFREATQDALEDAGYLVLPARDGYEALARMRGITGPALAIIDLKMPGMNGQQLISTMRANKDLAHIPILVITAKTCESIKGANRTLRKPIELDDLLSAIEGLMTQIHVCSMIG